MGLISTIIGGASAARQVGSVAEVFVGNRAERDAAASTQTLAAVNEFSAEFATPASTWFDVFVNGLNRLPRPMLALSTIGLFAYAMAAPAGFSVRMRSLALVPEPLWWLLGAIVSFYFGARELHHQRTRALGIPGIATVAGPVAGLKKVSPNHIAAIPVPDPDYNAAVEEWRHTR